ASGSPLRGQRVNALFNACGVVRIRAPLIQRNQPDGWFFAIWSMDSPSNSVRLFAASGSPLRGQRVDALFNACGVVRALPFLFYVYLSVTIFLKFNNLG
ncbi:hypothetical protein ACLEEZ_09155, partial [Lonsdalea quercina]|uniref:hypothetical protein n=1 Tax=Lonsdalea quercina TaxID=71657 RepID=UPI003974928B